MRRNTAGGGKPRGSISISRKLSSAPCTAAIPGLSFLMAKLYLTYNDIHDTVQVLYEKIVASGFQPDHMIAIGTGGFIPARMLKTRLERPIITVGLAYYDLDDRIMPEPVVTQWVDDPANQVTGRKILLVDEVDDTRTTIGYTLGRLLRHQPAEIAVAVLHNKRKPKTVDIPAEVTKYLVGREYGDDWICYPWDADDIREQDRLASES